MSRTTEEDARLGAGHDAAGVSPENAVQLFACLKCYTRVALAVSGGSDSTALMWLLARWRAQEQERPSLHVLTVDHGLRPDSAKEARAVVKEAAALGLLGVLLQWDGPKPVTGLQDAAREARYGLMIDWCARNGVPALLTAHTLDDQAETFLMRLARGSGLDGLSGIGDSARAGIAILRPLLGVSRARLRATLQAAGVPWIEDPSNDDDRFERVRWRKALAVLAAEGIEAADIGRSADRLARAREALSTFLGPLLSRAVTYADGRAEIDGVSYDQAPEELRVRLFRHVLERIGGGGPELAAVERLVSALHDTTGRAQTLAGCRIERRGERILVTREGPRGRRSTRPAEPR